MYCYNMPCACGLHSKCSAFFTKSDNLTRHRSKHSCPGGSHEGTALYVRPFAHAPRPHTHTHTNARPRTSRDQRNWLPRIFVIEIRYLRCIVLVTSDKDIGYLRKHMHAFLKFYSWLDSHNWPTSNCKYFEITLSHTTVSRTPPNEWSALRRDLYLTTHNTHKTQTSMTSAGFKPAVPANKRPQTHTLARPLRLARFWHDLIKVYWRESASVHEF